MEEASKWFREVGAGMGAALNTASGMNAYIMSDRASWLNFGNKGDLALLFAGDPILFNQYAYIGPKTNLASIATNGHFEYKEPVAHAVEFRKSVDGHYSEKLSSIKVPAPCANVVIL